MPRLWVDEIVSVGMVKAGDNPGAEVLIYKSRENTDDPNSSGNMHDKAESRKNSTGERMDLSAIENEDLRKSIEDALAEKDAQIAELTKEEPDPVADAPDDVKAIIKAQEDEIAKVREDLAKERKQRRLEKFAQKADELKVLGKDMGPVLEELESAAPEAYAKLESALTAISQQADLAKVFSELGAGEGEGESDPTEARDAYVQKALESGSDKTPAQLRAEFWKTDKGREMKQESRS